MHGEKQKKTPLAGIKDPSHLVSHKLAGEAVVKHHAGRTYGLFQLIRRSRGSNKPLAWFCRLKLSGAVRSCAASTAAPPYAVAATSRTETR